MPWYDRPSLRCCRWSLWNSLLQARDDSFQLLESTVLLFDLAPKSLQLVSHVDAILVVVADSKRGVIDGVAFALHARESRQGRSPHGVYVGGRQTS